MERINTKHVTTVTITDPDSGLPVEVEIRKLESGAMVGLDGSFLEQMGEEDAVYSPYDEAVQLEVPDDEPAATPSEPVEVVVEMVYDDFSPLTQSTPSRLESVWMANQALAAEAVVKMHQTVQEKHEEFANVINAWIEVSSPGHVTDSVDAVADLALEMLEDHYTEDDESEY